MSAPPSSDVRPEVRDDAQHYKNVLRDLVDMAADIARQFHHEITAGYAEAPARAAAFDRAARTIRRTILLAHHLEAPRTRSHDHPVGAIDPAFATSARAAEADPLRAECREQLDRLDRDEDPATRPVQVLVDELLQDLGTPDTPRHATTPKPAAGRKPEPGAPARTHKNHRTHRR